MHINNINPVIWKYLYCFLCVHLGLCVISSYLRQKRLVVDDIPMEDEKGEQVRQKVREVFNMLASVIGFPLARFITLLSMIAVNFIHFSYVVRFCKGFFGKPQNKTEQ